VEQERPDGAGPESRRKRRRGDPHRGFGSGAPASGLVGIRAPHGPYSMASLLIDEQDLHRLFYEDPGYYRELMELSLDRVHEYMRAVDAPGVDMLHKAPPGSFGMGGLGSSHDPTARTSARRTRRRRTTG